MAGVDLTTIEGIEEGTALVILSEIGTDMHRWPSVKHFCSWLGLCPQHKISGGKVLSRRVRPGAHRVAVALRLAARTVQHARTALGAFYRRMRSRLGAPKAITATAHKLARLVSSLFKHGSASVQQGLDASKNQYRERKVKAMARQAQALGSTLVALSAPEGQSLDAVAAPISCAGTTRPRCPIPCGGKGGVSHTPAQCPPADPIPHATTPAHPSTPLTFTGLVPWEARILLDPMGVPLRSRKG